MGHYDDQYETEYEKQAKEKLERFKQLKKEYPDDPSKWGLDIEDRVKMLEEQIRKLESRVNYLYVRGTEGRVIR